LELSFLVGNLKIGVGLGLLGPRRLAFLAQINYQFFGQNFRTTNAKWSIIDSKDAGFRLIFIKNKKQNIDLWGWGPGPVT